MGIWNFRCNCLWLERDGPIHSLTACRNQERWAWICLLVSLGVWYVTDTLLSLKAGVYFNATFNSLLLMQVVILLLFTYPTIFRKNK